MARKKKLTQKQREKLGGIYILAVIERQNLLFAGQAKARKIIGGMIKRVAVGDLPTGVKLMIMLYSDLDNDGEKLRALIGKRLEDKARTSAVRATLEAMSRQLDR